MPKPIKKRVQKKDITDIEVGSVYERLTYFYYENRKNVHLGAALAVLLILLVTAGVLYGRKVRAQAEDLQYEGYRLYYGLYSTPGEKDGEETLKKALEKFRQSYEKKSSPVTLFYVASTQLKLGRNDEALKTLEEFTRKYPRNKDLLPLAYYKIAMIQIREGKKEEALKTLESLYSLKTSPYLKDLALYTSARLLGERGEKEAALKKYEELVSDYPDSPYYQAALAEVKKEEKKEAGGKESNGGDEESKDESRP